MKAVISQALAITVVLGIAVNAIAGAPVETRCQLRLNNLKEKVTFITAKESFYSQRSAECRGSPSTPSLNRGLESRRESAREMDMPSHVVSASTASGNAMDRCQDDVFDARLKYRQTRIETTDLMKNLCDARPCVPPSIPSIPSISGRFDTLEQCKDAVQEYIEYKDRIAERKRDVSGQIRTVNRDMDFFCNDGLSGDYDGDDLPGDRCFSYGWEDNLDGCMDKYECEVEISNAMASSLNSYYERYDREIELLCECIR